jgi:hypothetical protein
MSSLNCSLLVHTFNKYERYWDGFLSGFQENFNQYLPTYFGSDTKCHSSHDFQNFKVIYSGEGEWSDRLIKLLQQIPTDYVWYQQEDMWPCKSPPKLAELLDFVIKYDINRLQISPIVQFYSLTGDKIPLFFHYKSKYLVSHQPSIWKKDFLLSCLLPNEDPWKHEYEGTKRLNKPEMAGKIAIYPHNWFSHESISARIV